MLSAPPIFNQKAQSANHKMTKDVFDDFFESYEKICFNWVQQFNFEGLWGRAQSSSYSPAPGHPNHEPLKKAPSDLFEKYQNNGKTNFEYVTELIIGS